MKACKIFLSIFLFFVSLVLPQDGTFPKKLDYRNLRGQIVLSPLKQNTDKGTSSNRIQNGSSNGTATFTLRKYGQEEEMTIKLDGYRDVESVVARFESGAQFVQSHAAIGSVAGWETIMTEDFESGFPSTGWSAYSSSGFTDAYWDDNTHRPNTGSRSVWCAAGGSEAGSTGGPYVSNMLAWMKYGPFDLTDAVVAKLDFYCWYELESDNDKFLWTVSTDGSNFSGFRYGGNSNGWGQFSVDLNSTSAGTVTGQSQVWIAFVFESNDSDEFEGAYVDDIALQKAVDATTYSETEPNNNPDQAQIIYGPSPVVINGIADVNDVGEVETPWNDDVEDLFLVTISAPGLRINLGAFDSDCDLLLYDLQAQTVLNSSSAIGPTVPEWIIMDNLPAGSYLIGVAIYDEDPQGGSTTPYTLTVDGELSTGSDETVTVLQQNFDSDAFPPQDWATIVTNSSNTWKKSNVTDHSFSEIDPNNQYSAVCPWVAEDQDEWLITPPFSLGSGSASLDFYAGYSTAWLGNATLKLHISTDDGTNWTELWKAEDDGQSWGWRQRTIDLSSYADMNNLKLAWQYVGNDGDAVAIDGVVVITTGGTSGSAPTVTTNVATSVDTGSAILNGTVNPNGLSTTVTFEYGETTSYGSTVTATQSPVSGTEDVLVSASLTDLSPSMTYHYRVVATNSVGTTNGDNQTFTTLGNSPTVTTNVATSVDTNSAILNGTVNPNGLSTTVTFEYGETTSYGNTITATQSPVSGTNSVSVSALLTDLSPSITHNYRVVATNSVGTNNGDNQTFTILGDAPTVTTNVATSVDTSSAILNGTVNPNRLSTTVTFEYGTTTSYGNTVTADQSPVSGANSVAVSANLTGLSDNTTYHYQVVATNSAGTINGSNQSFTTLLSYPSTFTVNTSVSFPSLASPSDYSETDFRMIGLPGESNLSVGTLLSGDQGVDWQVYWDNGAASDYLVEYDGSSKFRFSTGRAFWLIHKGPWSVSRTVPSAPLNESRAVEIPLHLGWNLITNPFVSSIPWSTIQNINGFSRPIYSFSGSFDTPSNFSPYKGYYYFNEENLMTLSIPYTSGGLTKTLVFDNEDDEGWKINITLSTGDILEQTTWFGVAPDASRGKDRFDYRKPRTVGPVPSVYFHRPEWDPDYSTFATDIRPEFSELETWNFSVHSSPLESVELAFQNIDLIPVVFEAYLIDEKRSRYFNLREDPRYIFTPVTKESNFVIVVGKENVINERLTSVLPKKFALGNNFPNPFNPVTTVPVDIPFRSNITITIYDLLGREVTTIYTGPLEAGRHFFTWNGRDRNGNPVSTGIYIARLNTSTGVTFSGKMVLIK